MHVKSNAAPGAYVPCRQTEGSSMKATDMDTNDTSRDRPERPVDLEWLGAVGAGVAIVLICAVWTFWI
jgi:hypothetical protein